MSDKTCPHCGTKFKYHKKKKFCSVKCKNRYNQKYIGLSEKDCGICGTKFMARTYQKYCSYKCKSKAALGQEKQRKAVEVPVELKDESLRMRALRIYYEVAETVLSAVGADPKTVGSIRADKLIKKRKHAIIAGIKAYREQFFC